MFEDDLATIFADPLLNESATIGAASTSGDFAWEDFFDPDGNGSFAQVKHRTFTFELGSAAGRAFAAVAVFGASITINSVTYKIRDARFHGQHQKKVILA